MKKLTLNVDALAVSSFETQGVEDRRGTVDGQEATTLPHCATGDSTCVGACFCTEYQTCFDCTVA